MCVCVCVCVCVAYFVASPLSIALPECVAKLRAGARMDRLVTEHFGTNEVRVDQSFCTTNVTAGRTSTVTGILPTHGLAQGTSATAGVTAGYDGTFLQECSAFGLSIEACQACANRMS